MEDKSRDAEVKEVKLWPVITVNRTIFFKYSLLLSDYSITSSIFHTKNTTIVFWVGLSITNTPGQRLDFLSLRTSGSYSQSVCFSGRVRQLVTFFFFFFKINTIPVLNSHLKSID